MPAPIGTLGNVPALTVAGRVFTDVSTLKILTGEYSGTSLRTSFREGTSTTNYSVPVGKTFQILAVRVTSVGSGAGQTYLSYADNGVNLVSTTAFTNPVYFGGLTTQSLSVAAYDAGSGVSGTREISTFFNVPAGKFPSAAGTGGASDSARITIFGYEV